MTCIASSGIRRKRLLFQNILPCIRRPTLGGYPTFRATASRHLRHRAHWTMALPLQMPARNPRRQPYRDYDKRGEGVPKSSSTNATGSGTLDLIEPAKAISSGRAERARLSGNSSYQKRRRAGPPEAPASTFLS
jgi:hypothetical protein